MVETGFGLARSSLELAKNGLNSQQRDTIGFGGTSVDAWKTLFDILLGTTTRTELNRTEADLDQIELELDITESVQARTSLILDDTSGKMVDVLRPLLCTW